ncbi:ExbD/TolR family protein [Octadecabacter ascidiaceicola]|uniref:Biopolymer transport protein ExbD n=1 Tax=Octadecabacter ascidiaceicola TaxID=1655543 RepID=A0A238K3F0_9RHOB|nr:ExbD/TolR family protein [Octadecabacter ascidiaceicola]SMX36987.1 Biopolymer transport protein ExbD [Octadecabacter ascidiaceicola]
MGAGVMKQADGGGGRRARRRGRRSMPMSEINVTPFVDVMLVLLIIFMVAAPLSVVGVPVQTPETAASALPTPQEEPLTITLNAEGGVFIQETEVDRAELVTRLRGIAAERDSDQIFLRADGVNAWNEVAQIMGALNAAGFNNIGLVTDIGGPTLDGQDG